MANETTRKKTKICCLDIPSDIVKSLSEKFTAYDGSMGRRINVDGLNNQCGLELLPNYNFPVNIQEYEVFIQDLKQNEPVDYNKYDHKRIENTDTTSYYFISNYPQKIYDFRPYGSFLLSNVLHKYRNKPAIKILFVDSIYTMEYCVRDTSSPYGDRKQWIYNNYMHFHAIHPENIEGNEVSLCDNKLSRKLFESLLDDIEYYSAFGFLDEVIKVGKQFIPLLQTKNGYVVSYMWLDENDITIVLPQTSKKGELLNKVLYEVCFTYLSEYFPEVSESSWINNEEYYLPNQVFLIEEKERIKRQFDEDIKKVDEQISENKKTYSFLHEILTGTDDVLVRAVMVFLKWLGFSNVIDKDRNLDKKFNEEDIQVDLDGDEIKGNKLLVIECKGIGGTSTDAQCSQISKVVHRRGKERRSYDVHGLYIVNNQMHIEPIKRLMPPFNETQISDAENDERGLCYTWQLYNLYFEIEDGITTKEEARNMFFDNGMIDFRSHLKKVGVPHKYYKDKMVVCVKLGDDIVRVDDYFYYEENGRMKKVKIVSIEENKTEVSNGSFGFGLEHSIPSKIPLFVNR